MLVGIGGKRPDKAWTQAYRALQHGEARTACKEVRNLNFPATLINCAETFITLQEERHDADYNPDHRILRAQALDLINMAEKAIIDLKATARRDRRAFAVQLLFRKRS